MISGRWWHGQFFFFFGLGLSLGAKLVSTNDRSFIFLNNIPAFPSGGEKTNCPAFCTNRLEVLGMTVDVFAQQESKI